MSNYFQFGFRDYPSKDENGKAGHFDGVAVIKLCKPSLNPDWKGGRWTVDGFHDTRRQGNCAPLPETAWNILDLERWLRGKHLSEIEARVTAAEQAEGR